MADATPEPTPEAAAEAREKAAAALKQVWEARRDKEKSAAPVTPKNPQEARLLAEGAFQHGVAFLHGGNFPRAVEQLKRAVELVPGAKEYALHAQWAEYAADATLDEAQRKKALVELGTAAGAALGELPDLGFAHYVLGQVRLFVGNEDQAKKFFRRARQLDPALVDAERQLRILELRKSKDPASPPAASAAASPAPTPKQATAAALPSRTRTLVLGGGLLVVVLAAAVVLWPSKPATPAPFPTTQKPQPPAPPTTTVPSTTAKPTVTNLPSATPGVAPPSVMPSTAPSASQTAGDSYGELSTGPAGRGHRVLFDGHSIGDGPGPFHVRCGAHTVQIGSAGAVQHVEVPCGGTLRVD